MSGSLGSSQQGRLHRFRTLVLAETGIRLPPAKDVMIESRLRKRLLALDLPSLDAYLAHLFDEGGLSDELPAIIDLLTTNKTDFFREPAHFSLLANRMIPEALARCRPGRSAQFRFWSAAASTGAEAWSAAMVLASAAARDPRLDWRILGTDISRRVLNVARTAVYPLESFAPVPPSLRESYVMPSRARGEKLGRIVPELRARALFDEMNLIDDAYALDNRIDVAFLRNVLIYFDPEMQQQVVASVASHLRPGGYLVVGHAESMIVRLRGFSAIAPGVYRKEELS